MRVISFFSAKGGTGKTKYVLGKKVIALDFDPLT